MLITTSIPINWLNNLDNLFKTEALTPNPPDTVQLAGGMGYSVILKQDGSLWTFGRNDLGQLGLNDAIDRSQPTRIDPSFFNNKKIIRVETTSTKVMALTENNDVYIWGDGNRKPYKVYSSSFPILDIEVSGYTDVNSHTSQHIVNDEGKVLSSGSNYQAAFGNGLRGYSSANYPCSTTYSRSSTDFSQMAFTNVGIEACASKPTLKNTISGTEVPLTNIIDLANDPNKRYLLALDISNNLYIWGEGKPALATKTPNSSNLTISKIEAGSYPTFTTTDGKLYYYPDYTSDPVEITLEDSTEKIIDIKSGEGNLLVLSESGKLYGLGSNNYGQLGSLIASSGVSWNSKVAMYTGINNVKRIGVGVGHSILQFNDDQFATLGRNSYGQLATTDVNTKSIFTKNPYLSNVKDINSNYYVSFGVTTDDKLFSWGGRDTYERLLRSGPFNSPQIVKDFSTISPIKELNGDGANFLQGGALLENGEYRNFGTTTYKRGLGKNTSEYDLSPLVNTNAAINDGRSFNLISAYQSLFGGIALSDENKVYTWGYDANGLLGLGYQVTEIVNGTTEHSGLNAFQEPVVPSDEVYKKVFAGSYEKFILTEDGKVYAWGTNTNFRLGLPNSSIDYSVPTLVNTLPPIKDIALGQNHTLFLDFEGYVWAVGHNGFGQLGIGNTTSPNIPTRIPSLSNVTYIASGDYSSYAVLSSGEFYSFGDNRYGQLGLGDFIQRNEPRLVSGISDIKEIDGGLKHAMLITNSGDLYVTGSDAEGQLGLGQSQVNSSPITVVFPPNVSIYNTDNQIYSTADTLDISGDIYTETEGITIDVSYDLESQSGKTTTFVKSYTTTSTPEPYSFSIPLNGFELGSYTITVKAVTSTGVTGQASINFATQDMEKPTISVDVNTIPKWAVSPATVNVTADDTGGSGYRGFRYSITNSTSMPINWSSIDPSKTKGIAIDQSGTMYLHLEAYDNIGNVTYLRAGPYYMDLSAPDFIFTEPAKWQQDSLNLGVTVQDVSTITLKKWKQGTASMDEVKNTGNTFSTTSLPITMNGIYSFYAIDENNQESFETYEVTNINYTPSLHTAPPKIIVPSINKTNALISTNFSHDDSGDVTQLVTDLGSYVFTSTTTFGSNALNKDQDWYSSFNSLSENTLYSGNVYLKDSRGGISNKVNTQLEVFNPNMTLKSKVTGMNISWTHSKLSPDYRLLRNGEVIFSGTNNSYFDNGLTNNTSYSYTLEVRVNGVYVEVENINKNSGYNFFETPSSILFPNTTIGNSSLSPTSMDLEYIKYEDFSDEITPYSLRVSMTSFTSASSSFIPESFVLKNIKKLDRSNFVEKNLADVFVTETPFELVGQSDTSSESYSKLEILKDNVEMVLPMDIKLNTQSTESFDATIIWDITYTP